MNRILQIALGTTIGILAAILIVAGAGAAWRVYQAAEARAAQAIQDQRDRVENEKHRIVYQKESEAERYQYCKGWIGTSNMSLERICHIITDATQFNSPGENAASYKQCLVDANGGLWPQGRDSGGDSFRRDL